jgi:hypothetical protein
MPAQICANKALCYALGLFSVTSSTIKYLGDNGR